MAVTVAAQALADVGSLATSWQRALRAQNKSPHGPSQAIGEFIARVMAAQGGA